MPPEPITPPVPVCAEQAFEYFVAYVKLLPRIQMEAL